MKQLKLNATAMVKIINPVNTSIKDGAIVPVVFTNSGLMVFSNAIGIHVDTNECQIVNMPLQCLIGEIK